MKKLNLTNLALCGLLAGSLTVLSSPLHGSSSNSNSQTTNSSKNNTQNKNSNAQASKDNSSSDSSSSKVKGKEPKSQPSAPGQEDCGAFCASADASQSQTTIGGNQLKVKRLKLI